MLPCLFTISAKAINNELFRVGPIQSVVRGGGGGVMSTQIQC